MSTTIKVCPVCSVSWYADKPEKHMMTCTAKAFLRAYDALPKLNAAAPVAAQAPTDIAPDADVGSIESASTAIARPEDQGRGVPAHHFMTRAPTEMEARVIAALDKVMRENHGKHMNVWADVMPPILARAAIRAMHTPTTEMLLGYNSFLTQIENWQIIIDAASPEEL